MRSHISVEQPNNTLSTKQRKLHHANSRKLSQFNRPMASLSIPNNPSHLFFTLDTLSSRENFAGSTLLPSHDSLVWYTPSRVPS
jgi:hypothetical protein